MSVDRLEQLFAAYQEDGYAPVPTDLLDWALLEIEGLEDRLAEADREVVDDQLTEWGHLLAAYCYELLGTHNPTPLDLRNHPALQRLLDAVR